MSTKKEWLTQVKDCMHTPISTLSRSKIKSQQRTCEGPLLSSTEVVISDCFAELEVAMVDAITEGGEGGEEETEGEFLLIDKALTNRSPSDPRSCVEGGSSLKNKLLYRKMIYFSQVKDIEFALNSKPEDN